MQKLAEICIRRPVFAAMMILALVVIGASSYSRLGVDRFPQVDIPTVMVRTMLPGAGPEEVETLVSDIVVMWSSQLCGPRSDSGRATRFWL